MSGLVLSADSRIVESMRQALAWIRRAVIDRHRYPPDAETRARIHEARQREHPSARGPSYGAPRPAGLREKRMGVVVSPAPTDAERRAAERLRREWNDGGQW